MAVRQKIYMRYVNDYYNPYANILLDESASIMDRLLALRASVVTCALEDLLRETKAYFNTCKNIGVQPKTNPYPNRIQIIRDFFTDESIWFADDRFNPQEILRLIDKRIVDETKDLNLFN